jgi:hypothetical protein
MPLTPDQVRTRDRVERVIRLMVPGLGLVLAAGERLSRLVAPEDDDFYPVRPSTLPPEPSPGEPPPARD